MSWMNKKYQVMFERIVEDVSTLFEMWHLVCMILLYDKICSHCSQRHLRLTDSGGEFYKFPRHETA